ncbi:MAG: GFA family protein [Brevirhabdus sp.]
MTRDRTLSCHCGAVELRVRLSDKLEQARHCDCSMCRRRGAAMVSVPLDQLNVVKGADKLTLYQFNTNTAQHYFCSVCGIYTHHKRRSNPNEYGVNLGALEGVNPADYEPLRWSDGVNHPSDRTG